MPCWRRITEMNSEDYLKGNPVVPGGWLRRSRRDRVPQGIRPRRFFIALKAWIHSRLPRPAAQDRMRKKDDKYFEPRITFAWRFNES